MTVRDMTQPMAVLVDGDNISGKNAAAILGIAKAYGDPIVVRAYLDVQHGGLSSRGRGTETTA